jgi:aldehyde dehydrogenase (NAD+)
MMGNYTQETAPTRLTKAKGTNLAREISATIEHFLASLSFGEGAINEVNVHLFVESMPFGGVGNFGIGNYYGKYGFDSLTHAKSILISPADVDIDHLFPPYTAEKVQALN